jgi:hypothetical protein
MLGEMRKLATLTALAAGAALLMAVVALILALT